MMIVITGAAGNTGPAAAEALLAQGREALARGAREFLDTIVRGVTSQSKG